MFMFLVPFITHFHDAIKKIFLPSNWTTPPPPLILAPKIRIHLNTSVIEMEIEKVYLIGSPNSVF